MPPTIIFPLIFLSLLLSTVLSQQEEFIYYGFDGGGSSSNNNISLNGVSEIEGTGILRLTNDTSRLIGRAFYPNPLHFKNSAAGSAFSFSTAFAFAVVPEYPTLGGHGLAFTIAPSKELPGGLPSQYLGLLNASNIGNASNHLFAVEFDTVQDFEFGDINDNHVGIDINNLVSNASVPASYFDDQSMKQDLNLKSGVTIQAWVEYDGVAKLLNVTISPFSTKPRKPIISFQVDLSSVFMESMFVGFSSSTGLLASSHYLLGWSFKMNGAAKSLDLLSLPSLPRPAEDNTNFVLIVSFSAVALLIAGIVAATYLLFKVKTAEVIEPWEREHGPHRFSYKELKMATRGFGETELLGVGGFGRVYRGTLPDENTVVAVKRVSHDSKQGLREFVAEIASIGRLRHRNLVQLQGWCRRQDDLLLVYDFMPNGSLDKFLFDMPPGAALSWHQRFKILHGVASALLYLHEEWEHIVLHRDVKASNVMLDADLNGRLGDFGLAKLYEHGSNPTTTRVMGTVGYIAPELPRTGKASTFTDVYAFGVLMLEVVAGRRPFDPSAPPKEVLLVDWVWERWGQGRWMEVVDRRLDGGYVEEEAEVAVKVGLMCSHPSTDARPSMREVVRYLDGNVSLPELSTLPADHERKSRLGFDVFLHSYPSSSSVPAGLGGGEGDLLEVASSP